MNNAGEYRKSFRQSIPPNNDVFDSVDDSDRLGRSRQLVKKVSGGGWGTEGGGAAALARQDRLRVETAVNQW